MAALARVARIRGGLGCESFVYHLAHGRARRERDVANGFRIVDRWKARAERSFPRRDQPRVRYRVRALPGRGPRGTRPRRRGSTPRLLELARALLGRARCVGETTLAAPSRAPERARGAADARA